MNPLSRTRTRLSPLRSALRADLRDDSRVSPYSHTPTTHCCDDRLSSGCEPWSEW